MQFTEALRLCFRRSLSDVIIAASVIRRRTVEEQYPFSEIFNILKKE